MSGGVQIAMITRVTSMLATYAFEVIALLSLFGAIAFIVVSNIIDGIGARPLTALVFQVLALTSLLTLLVIALSNRRTARATLQRIGGITWTSDAPSAEQLLHKLKASKVYIVASALGRTSPDIRQLMRHTSAYIEVFCPDPNLNLLPPHAAKEQGGHLATLEEFRGNSSRLQVWATANPPTASVAVFVGSDDLPLGGYISWYAIWRVGRDPTPTGNSQILHGRGLWGAITLSKGDDESATQLLNRAFEYVKALQGDPSKRRLL